MELVHAPWPVYLFFIGLSLLALVFIHSSHYSKKKGRYIKSLAIYLHIFCWGLFITKYYQLINYSLPLNNTSFCYVLKESWEKKKNYYTARASFQYRSAFKSGDVLIQLKSDSPPKGKIGDLIITKSETIEVLPPKNPYQFNYKSYLEKLGISHVLYLKEDRFIERLTGKQSLLKRFDESRKSLVHILDESILNLQARSFIKAILLGDKSELDPLTSDAFRTAGATHVLAVSGLHVGIIVSLFARLFSLLFSKIKKEKTVWIRTLFLLSIIWLYAGLTGFSPSIFRASMMFSFLSIGQSLIRKTSIYNSLSMAAFFMLLIDPNNLFKVGFQLSFVAVIGIVYFYPIFSKMLFFQNKLFQKVWNLCSVSLAAQLATFPLSIYYFHQFPNYFLVSNILVIPAAFIILLLSILLLVLSFIEPLFNLLAVILNTIISMLNRSMEAIKDLPYSNIDNIYISSLELWGLYLIIIFAALFFRYKKVKLLMLSLGLCLLVVMSQIQHKINHHSNYELFIYHVPYRNALDLIYNTKHTLFLDKRSYKKPSKLAFTIDNNLLVEGLDISAECDKVMLNDTGFTTHSHYLKSKDHLIMKNTLLCINHSSHNTMIPIEFKRKILYINISIPYKRDEFKKYDLIVLNDWSAQQNKVLLEANIDLSYNPMVYDLLEKGSYRLILSP